MNTEEKGTPVISDKLTINEFQWYLICAQYTLLESG